MGRPVRYLWAVPFFGSFLVYLITLAPTVTFWDSGELISASWLLGVSHQPGYPLFCLMGKVFSFLPFGNIAYRANLLSAFFSSLALAVLYFILIEIAEPPIKEGPTRRSAPTNSEADARNQNKNILAALAALLPAFMKQYWSQAVVTEVYGLNSFFVMLLVFVWVLAARDKLSPERYFALSGLVFGLGLVNHQSLILYAPALFISWLIIGREGKDLKPLPIVGEGGERGINFRQRFKLVLLSLFFIALGLSVYLYLPLRSMALPLMNLGHPDSYARFGWTVKWGEYFRAGIPFRNLVTIVCNARLSDPRVILGVPLAVLFIWRALRRDWKLYLPIIMFLLVYLAGISMETLGGEEEDKFGLAAKFFIPAFLVAVPLVYAEAAELWCSYEKNNQSRFLLHTFISRERKVWGLAVAALFAVVIVVLLRQNYFYEDNSRHFFAFDYAQNSLKSVGRNGVLFTWGDNGAFPLWYLHDVEKYRDDAVLIHTPLMTYDWYLRDVNDWLGKDVRFLAPYYLGENVYRVLKAVTPRGRSTGRTVAYDYSTTKFLNMDTNKLHVRGLVYFEGPTPPGNPWKFYVFRGVENPKVYKGPMEQNIIQIYNYQRQVAGPPSFPL